MHNRTLNVCLEFWSILLIFLIPIYLLTFSGSPENGMTYFWITDSCPRTVKEVKDRKPFEVLSLAAPIAAALQI